VRPRLAATNVDRQHRLAAYFDLIASGDTSLHFHGMPESMATPPSSPLSSPLAATPSLPAISLRSLEIFVTVANAGSMNAAADMLRSSQPAISQAVTSLEQALGAKLFDRSVRPAALTWAGKVALKHATDIVTGVKRLSEATRAHASEPVPVLRVGMIDSFTASLGAFLIQELRELATKWTVVSGYGPTHLQALFDRTIDVVVTLDEMPKSSEIYHRAILRESFLLAVPSDWDVSGGLQGIASTRDYISFGRQAYMGSILERYFEREHIRPNQPYQFNTMDAILSMVSAGLGWTMVTPLVVLKSKCDVTKVRLLPLGKRSISRQMSVAMLQSGRTDIVDNIHAASVRALRENIIPELNALLPWLGDEIKVIGAK